MGALGEARVDVLEQTKQMTTRAVRTIIRAIPAPRIHRALKTGLYCGDHVVFVLKESACKHVYIFPAAQNVTVYHERYIEAERLREHPGRRVKVVGGKKKTSAAEFGEEHIPVRWGVKRTAGDSSNPPPGVPMTRARR